jgi:hypothetical protein
MTSLPEMKKAGHFINPMVAAPGRAMTAALKASPRFSKFWNWS